MKTNMILTCMISLFLLSACSNSSNKPNVEAEQLKVDNHSNYLTMKINGKEWSADHDVFGAFHPKGYDKAIIISGSSGKKDKTEKAFNINIFQTDGPGQYSFAQGNAALSVAQMGNWTEQDYTCGSMMGFDMKVKVVKATTGPDILEATFSGTLSCPSGPALVITDGKFYYHE